MQIRELGRIFELCSDEIDLEPVDVPYADRGPRRPWIIARREDA